MNKPRRKEIEKIIEELEGLKERIESVGNEEQEAYDNLPERIQYSEKGEAMENAASELDGVAGDIEDLIDRLQEIVDG